MVCKLMRVVCYAGFAGRGAEQVAPASAAAGVRILRDVYC